MRLANWHSYLVIRDSVDTRGASEVLIVSDLAAAVAGWDYRTRVSPVYGLTGITSKSEKQHRFPGRGNLFFIGPLSPYKMSALLVRLSHGSDAWMAVGAFNFVVQGSREEDLRAIKAWLRPTGSRHERWTVNDGRVQQNPDYTLSRTIGKAAIDSLV